MSNPIDRRTFVRSALTAGAGVLLAPTAGWSVAQKARLATEGAFAQRVASGEPATDAITLDAPPHNPLNTDSWDGYGAERAELIDHIASAGIDDVTFVTGDIHTFFAGDVTRTGRQTVRGEDRTDPVNGPARATESVGGAITSPGIVDRAASTEAQRVAAAAPADAAVLANNPHMAYANQAYKGYCILKAGAGQLDVRYQAVHEHRDPASGVFTLRPFRVDSGQPVVIDDGGPPPA